MASQFTSNQEKKKKQEAKKWRKIYDGTSYPSKSGGARNESSSPDVTAARLAAVSELSVSFEEKRNMVWTPKMITMIMKKDAGPEPGAATPETATLSSGLSGATKSLSRNLAAELDDVAGPDPDYDDFNDGTEGSKPSRWGMTYPSTMSLQDWSPHEAGAALQKWKKKLRKAFGAIGINEGKQPVSRLATLEEDPSKGSSVLLRLSVEPIAMLLALPTLRPIPRLAHGDATFNKSYATYGRRGRGFTRPSRRGTSFQKCDDDDLLRPTYEDEDPQAELTRQMREIAALNDSDPTPRIEMASHRPLDRIKPFSGSRNKSENSMQWLRTFVYEMTGTHTEADKWCIPFELSLRDGAIHWFRQLPKKTKRTWKLLSNAFIRYYCSQFTQTALSRYYSAKRERSEHLCDYLNRLNGYARNARLQFEKGGRDAKEHVQQFLVTCGDDNMAESLYHTRVNDIHELEEIIEDVLKGKERMAKPVIPGAMSPMTVKADVTDVSQTVVVRLPQHTRVTLADASLDDLLAELEGREATRSGTERSDGEHHAHEDDQDEYDHYQSDDASSDGSLVDNDRHLAAANKGERRAAAEGTYARSDNHVAVANAASIKTVEVVTEASVKTLVVDVTSTATTGAHSRTVCSLRWDEPLCSLLQQALHCELFRNFQDLAKFVRIKGTKEELPPELKSVVQERHLN
ncbi:Retrotransposon gag domain [Phytophthora cactorum]|nr:Retrotransposon gag domain [Phytophthora cactorum]